MDEIKELLNELRDRLRDHESRLRILERVAWVLLGATLLHGGVDLTKYLTGK